jgi:hypothetical protein
MAETQIQSKDVEEVDDEKEPSDDKVFMDLHSGMGYISGSTQSNAHPNWSALKSAKLV